MSKKTSFIVRTLLAVMLVLAINGQAGASGEAAVKTAFLYNFFKFIEWPQAASQVAYNLCTTENDHLGDSLLVLENKTIYGKPMLVRREVGNDELKNCHIVFIGASENARAIIGVLKGLPIVTVSDQPGFIAHGGMIGLVQDGSRLTFEINLELANAENVHISAKLLKLAKNVNTAK